MSIQPFSVMLVCWGFVLAACNPVGDVQRYVRGQQLKHADVMPPTAGAYIVAAGLPTTTALTLLDPATNQTVTITDQATLRQVLALLANGKPSTNGAGVKPTQPLKLTLTLDPPDREVTWIYFPDQDRVSLYNVPTVAWPQHYVGNYTVAPEFGAALLETLVQP